MRSPEKNLPKALVLGTRHHGRLLRGGGGYLYMVPIQEMFAVKDNRIAAEAAQRMIGAPGAAFIAIAIMISTFGCVNGLILAGARVLYAMSRDKLFFKRAGDVHPVYRTPAPALLLQGAVAAVLTLTGTYNDLLTMVAFVSLLFNTLTVVALFVLRRRRPDRRGRTAPGAIRFSRPLHRRFDLLPLLHPRGGSAERRNRPRPQRPGASGLRLLEPSAGVTSDKSLT